MVNKKLRFIIGLIIVVGTVVAVIFYFIKHRNLITELGHISLLTLLSVFLLYIVMLGVLLVVLDATLRLCYKHLVLQENLFLNAYTLMINYFIPGQGGPIFRGAYLRKKHNLKVRNYIAASLAYFALYALVSVMLVAIGSRPWWQSILIAILSMCVIASVVTFYAKKQKVKKSDLNIKLLPVGYLLVATLTQAILQVIIYYVELHSTNQHASLGQILTYTGIANLALFVSITPGAIGIRESFLLITEKINHISSGNILVANVIDRSVYLLFIIALSALTLAFTANNKYKFIQKFTLENLTMRNS